MRLPGLFDLPFRKQSVLTFLSLSVGGFAVASEVTSAEILNLTAHPIGSAAGVALTGQAHGKYTFFSHLRWTPVIALG
ncbi:MAG: hypothetical protein WBO73_09980 [Gammaproteobacteria bacterium]|jgi:hypothetical protein